jgi:hypothetical protein
MIFAFGIFLSTILLSFITLMAATLIGAAIANWLPWRLRASGRFYLAPVLGLSALTLLASWMGRDMAFGHGYWPALAALGWLTWLLWRDPKRLQSLSHAASIGLFGLVCGVGILTPLFLSGGYNSHNDAFTNLAHAMWLQDHAFSEQVNRATVKPYATQILLYQLAGFRMGGSYLLALLQSVFQARWSYDVFPVLLIFAITACCMSIGMVLARPLRYLRRPVRFALLALPSFGIGGLTYGAFYGFMSQTVGLALGAGVLFLSGHLMLVLGRTRPAWPALVRATLPLTLLLSAAIVAYSEFAPFLCLILLLTALALAWKTGGFGNMARAAFCVVLLSCVMLNNELIRAYMALRLQAGVVVGTPVDWPLMGFVAHGLGVHGGAWGDLQWTTGPAWLTGGLILSGVLLILISQLPALWRQVRSGELLSVGLMLLILFCALLYFRYGVASPFPVGKGQSWSQAKLMDWAFPFSAALILAAITHWHRLVGKWLPLCIGSLFAIGLYSVVDHATIRSDAFSRTFVGVPNLQRFYLQIREAVQNTCPANAPVHLAVGSDFMKFRETLALYLYDRDLTADWRDDIYLDLIPAGRINLPASATSCFFEPRNHSGSAILTPPGRWQVRPSNVQNNTPQP